MGGPLATFGGSPSASRAISKSLKNHWFLQHFGALSSSGISQGGPGLPWRGPREVLSVFNLAQGDDLGGYFRFGQKTEKGQWPLTPQGESRQQPSRRRG